jgi:hypothetical protein
VTCNYLSMSSYPAYRELLHFGQGISGLTTEQSIVIGGLRSH